MGITFVMVSDIPQGGVATFQEYEARVLPLLSRHGGRLERRLRGQDGRCEVHIVSFDDSSGYHAYMADPERQAHRKVLAGVDVVQRLLQVTDV
jgi:uncharacterized protein (DUF1330 family)